MTVSIWCALRGREKVGWGLLNGCGSSMHRSWWGELVAVELRYRNRSRVSMAIGIGLRVAMVVLA